MRRHKHESSDGAKGVCDADPAAVLRLLKRHRVRLPRRGDVVEYLIEFPQLGEHLPEICRHVRRARGPAAELSLELYRDPEIDYRYLALFVREEQYQADIMDTIHALSKPFDDALEKLPGYLLVTTDFCPPGK
jgi:hypothetical protein